MNSNTEQPSKVRKTAALVHHHEDGEDRLSSFAESILCHILSFVPTKCAARTSILSRRWEYLFLNVPKLIFSDEDVISDNHDSFIEFVNRRLMLCKVNASITEFRLVLSKLPQLSVINLWILTLLFRDLKILQILESRESDTATPQCPPSAIFGWKTLVVLKLKGMKMVLNFPKSVFFPNLVELYLFFLEIQSESEYLRFDHEGYPLLERLVLHYVRFNFSKDNKAFLGRLGIFSRTLKNLATLIVEPTLLTIDIDTPSLRHLVYQIWETNDDNPVQLSFCKSEHLISADLYSDFNRCEFHAEILSKVSAVEQLILFDFQAQQLSYSLPHFDNLTYLELCQTPMESMFSLLGRAPLEVLVYELIGENFVPPTAVPLCLAEKLVGVRLTNFQAKDVMCVGYFLQHGAVLKRVTLDQKSNWSVSILEELLKLPRRSPECQIELLQTKEGN